MTGSPSRSCKYAATAVCTPSVSSAVRAWREPGDGGLGLELAQPDRLAGEIDVAGAAASDGDVPGLLAASDLLGVLPNLVAGRTPPLVPPS